MRFHVRAFLCIAVSADAVAACFNVALVLLYVRPSRIFAPPSITGPSLFVTWRRRSCSPTYTHCITHSSSALPAAESSLLFVYLIRHLTRYAWESVIAGSRQYNAAQEKWILPNQQRKRMLWWMRRRFLIDRFTARHHANASVEIMMITMMWQTASWLLLYCMGK